MHSIPFTAHGKNYEVRITSDGATIRLRAFDKTTGRSANGYEYSIGEMDNFDLKQLAGVDGVKELIKTAQDDVIVNRWENLLKAIASLKK